MAKFAILTQGSTYAIGSRVFHRGVSAQVDDDLAERLQDTGAFEIRDNITKKEAAKALAKETGSAAADGLEPGLTAPVPNAQAGSKTADKANDEAITNPPDPTKNAHTDSVNPPKK